VEYLKEPGQRTLSLTDKSSPLTWKNTDGEEAGSTGNRWEGQTKIPVRENLASSFYSIGQNPQGEEGEGISIVRPPFCRTQWHSSADLTPSHRKFAA